MRVRINVTGSDEVRTYLRALGPEAVNSTKLVLKQAAQEMVGPIKALAPKESGALAGSVRAGRPTYRKKTGEVSVAVIAGGGDVPYAMVHERGTWLSGRLAGVRITHDDGQSPFMDPVLLETVKTIPQRLLDRVLAVRRLTALGAKV